MVNAVRLTLVARQLNAMASKVFAAVPLQEAWAIHAIGAEMQRANGTRPAKDVIEGCLSQLVSVGLVKEPQIGMYRRVEFEAAVVKPSAAKTKPEVIEMRSVTAPPSVAAGAEKSPLDRLGEIAARVRKTAGLFNELADEIDAIGVLVEEHVAGSDEELKQLRQLKSLLKTLS